MNTRNIIEDVINQAKNGIVKIGDSEDNLWVFYPRFYTNIEGNTTTTNTKYPTINIPDYKKFISYVETYLKTAEKFYENESEYFDLKGENFDKKLFLDLIINASFYDFEDIYSYIFNRTKMLQDNVEIGTHFLGNFYDLKITSKISKNYSNLESPYRFDVIFSNENHSFQLPSIFFAFQDSKVYVMAIQNLNKAEQNPLSKKLDRFFRKVNKNVPTDDIISNVSPNALVALTVFLSYCQKLNKTEVIDQSFQPLRYHSNKVASYNKSKTLDEKHAFIEKHDKNQFNITNKFLYTFLRYEYHFSNAETFFDDNTQTLHLYLSKENPKIEDNLINEIDNSIRNQKEITIAETKSK